MTFFCVSVSRHCCRTCTVFYCVFFFKSPARSFFLSFAPLPFGSTLPPLPRAVAMAAMPDRCRGRRALRMPRASSPATPSSSPVASWPGWRSPQSWSGPAPSSISSPPEAVQAVTLGTGTGTHRKGGVPKLIRLNQLTRRTMGPAEAPVPAAAAVAGLHHAYPTGPSSPSSLSIRWWFTTHTTFVPFALPEACTMLASPTRPGQATAEPYSSQARTAIFPSSASRMGSSAKYTCLPCSSMRSG